jgi:small subunit ribosomal protein S2
MKELEAQEEDGSLNALPKQEQAVIRHELSKLQKNLGGVRDMKDLPDILFIVDPKKERNAVLEGNLLKIPIVATLDTNCDPDEIDYIIPGNDDAIRAIRLITSKIADAFLEGREGYNQQEQAEAAESDQPEAKDEDSEKQDDTVIENDKSEDADSVKKEEVVSD